MPYTLNGQAATVDEEPRSRNGILYVPLRSVVEALGGSINWDNQTRTIVASIGQWTARLQPDQNSAVVDGTPVQFSAPTIIENDTAYVPPDFFQAAYGYKVQANGTNVNIGL